MYRQSVLDSCLLLVGLRLQYDSCVLVGLRCTGSLLQYDSCVSCSMTHSCHTAKDCLYIYPTNNTQLSYCKRLCVIGWVEMYISVPTNNDSCVLLVGLRCTGSLLQYDSWLLLVVHLNPTNNTQLSYCSMTAVCYWCLYISTQPITHSCHTAVWQLCVIGACTSEMYRQSFAIMTAVILQKTVGLRCTGSLLQYDSCVLLVGLRCTGSLLQYDSCVLLVAKVEMYRQSFAVWQLSVIGWVEMYNQSFAVWQLLLVGLRCTGSLLQYDSCVLLVACTSQPNQ